MEKFTFSTAGWAFGFKFSSSEDRTAAQGKVQEIFSPGEVELEADHHNQSLVVVGLGELSSTKEDQLKSALEKGKEFSVSGSMITKLIMSDHSLCFISRNYRMERSEPVPSL